MKRTFFAFLALALVSDLAAAAPITYVGRCAIGTPSVNITLDSDPTAQIGCKMINSEAYLYMNSDVKLTVGTESYTITGQWDTYQTTCDDALATFKSGPWFPTTDSVSGADMSVILGTNRIDVLLKTTITMGCTGKIPGT